MLRRLMALLLAATLLPLFGCGPIEKTARDTIATATGALQQAQSEYRQECLTQPSASACVLINQAVHVQNLAITGLEIYCGFQLNVTPPTATCVPVKTAAAGLSATLSQLSAITGQITALLKSKPKSADLHLLINRSPSYAEIEAVRIQEAL